MTTDEERLAAILPDIYRDLLAQFPDARMGVPREHLIAFVALVERLESERDSCARRLDSEVHEHVDSLKALERLRARVARLESSARELLTANAESWTGGDATARAYDAEAKLRSVLAEGEAVPAGVASGIGLKTLNEDLVPVTETWHIGPDGKPDEYAIRIQLRDLSPAARLELVLDLHAPQDEDGVRHPEAGLIDAEQVKKLLEMP